MAQRRPPGRWRHTRGAAGSAKAPTFGAKSEFVVSASTRTRIERWRVLEGAIDVCVRARGAWTTSTVGVCHSCGDALMLCAVARAISRCVSDLAFPPTFADVRLNPNHHCHSVAISRALARARSDLECTFTYKAHAQRWTLDMADTPSYPHGRALGPALATARASHTTLAWGNGSQPPPPPLRTRHPRLLRMDHA